MKDLIIRNANATDMKDVLILIKELADFENASDQVKMTEEKLIEDGYGETPLFRSLIVEYRGEKCGYALFYFGYSTWNGKTLYLEDIMISDKYRRKGFGQELFNSIIKIARYYKVKRLDWQVLNWNHTDIEFYKKNQAIFEDKWINGRLFGLDLRNI